MYHKYVWAGKVQQENFAAVHIHQLNLKFDFFNDRGARKVVKKKLYQ